MSTPRHPLTSKDIKEILHLDMLIDLIDRYLAKKSPEWNKDHIHQFKAVVNFSTQTLLNRTFLAEIPKERRENCSKLISIFSTVTNLNKVCEAFPLLIQEALIGMEAAYYKKSEYYSLSTGIVSHCIKTLKEKEWYEKLLGDLKKKLSLLEENISKERKEHHNVMALLSQKKDLILQLACLEIDFFYKACDLGYIRPPQYLLNKTPSPYTQEGLLIPELKTCFDAIQDLSSLRKYYEENVFQVTKVKFKIYLTDPTHRLKVEKKSELTVIESDSEEDEKDNKNEILPPTSDQISSIPKNT